jgi:hypothetical protein
MATARDVFAQGRWIFVSWSLKFAWWHGVLKRRAITVVTYLGFGNLLNMPICVLCIGPVLVHDISFRVPRHEFRPLWISRIRRFVNKGKTDLVRSKIRVRWEHQFKHFCSCKIWDSSMHDCQLILWSSGMQFGGWVPMFLEVCCIKLHLCALKMNSNHRCGNDLRKSYSIVKLSKNQR